MWADPSDDMDEFLNDQGRVAYRPEPKREPGGAAAGSRGSRQQQQQQQSPASTAESGPKRAKPIQGLKHESPGGQVTAPEHQQVKVTLRRSQEVSSHQQKKEPGEEEENKVDVTEETKPSPVSVSATRPRRGVIAEPPPPPAESPVLGVIKGSILYPDSVVFWLRIRNPDPDSGS